VRPRVSQRWAPGGLIEGVSGKGAGPALMAEAVNLRLETYRKPLVA
jgi:hypothetical protein